MQSRLSFQVLPTLPEDATSKNLEAVDELSKEVGVEEKMKNIPLPSDDSSNNSIDAVKVLVPQADYMLGIAGKNDLSHFNAFVPKFGLCLNDYKFPKNILYHE